MRDQDGQGTLSPETPQVLNLRFIHVFTPFGGKPSPTLSTGLGLPMAGFLGGWVRW